jgi:hypothetical protein
MSQVSNDNEFRQQLDKLDKAQQRVLAANFIEHVLPLSGDERVARAVKVAADTDASSDELASALRSVTAAALDSHARCGADCKWADQAGYFVARAAMAALSHEAQSSGSPAWQAAMSSRMARTCLAIDSTDDGDEEEQLVQYRILDEYLNS